MQPLAIGALVIGAVMVLGVAVTLILTRRSTKPSPGGDQSLEPARQPPAGRGRSGDRHDLPRRRPVAGHGGVVYAVAATLLLAALLCAVVGATVATMARSGLRG